MTFIKVRSDLFDLPYVVPEEKDMLEAETLVFLRNMLNKLKFFYSFNCELCSYGTDVKLQIDEHKLTHEDILRCCVCKKDFKYEQTLMKHRQRFHGSNEVERKIKQEEPKRPADKPHPCNMCSKSYKYEKVLKTHMKKVHSVESVDLNGNHLINLMPEVEAQLSDNDRHSSSSNSLDQLPKRKLAYCGDKNPIAKRIRMNLRSVLV